MRGYFLFSALIVCLQGEITTICDICDCRQNNEPPIGIKVNCTFRGNILENISVLPNNATSINLSRSNLTTIKPTKLLLSTTLLELLLNKNSLKEIDPELLQLPELRRLDLSENKLVTLHPNLFKNVTKLEYLNLSDNKFTAVSQLNFNLLVNLKEIILDNNNIGVDIASRSLFDINGYGLKNIESISISGTNLKDLDSEYFKPVDRTLKKLIISNNNVTKIPILPQNLEYLDVSSNPIRVITVANFPFLIPLLYLRVLKLNNLEIEEIPKNVFSSLMLIHLELENNKKLKEFSNLTFGRQVLLDTYDFNVVNLTLKGANLTMLDVSLSGLFGKVKRLDLQQNPWRCDCRLAWIRNLPIDSDLRKDLRCSSPSYLYNKRIFDMNYEDFVCLKSKWDGSEIGMTIGLVLYVLLIIVTVSWIYVFIYQPARTVNKQEYSQIQ